MHSAAFGLLVSGMGVLAAGFVHADDRDIAALGDNELIQAYWYCDRQASRSAHAEERFDEMLMQFCGGISHALQAPQVQWGLRQALTNGPNQTGGLRVGDESALPLPASARVPSMQI